LSAHFFTVNRKPDYFRLGAFIALGVTLLIVGLLIFGGGQAFREKVLCETYVDGSVQGVDVGTPVKFRGVQIGRVRSINFLFNLYGDGGVLNQAKNFVVLVMEIDRQVSPGMFDKDMLEPMENNIAEGLRVRIEPQGITGLNFLDFGFVDPERYPPLPISWTPDNIYIPYAPGEITSALDSLNNLMRQVEKLNISGISTGLQDLLSNLNNAVLEAKVGDLSTQLRSLIAELKGALEEADIAAVSNDIRSLSEKLETSLDTADLGALGTDARQLIHGLRESNTRLQNLLGNIEPVTRPGSGDLQAVMTNATEISENLLILSKELKRRPSLILWGSPRDPRSENDESADPPRIPERRAAPQRPSPPGTRGLVR
jgi:ABC-type transporter Mla subunit MlaD